jgi:hypothetical protein
MGVTVSYQAIPPTSSFYKRLQQEQTLNILMVSLFPQGNGIFRFFDIDHLFPGDSIRSINNDLKRVMERHQEIFGGELESSLAVAEYRSELILTCRDYPGIEDRRSSMEKTSDEIREWLSRELSRINFVDADDIIGRIMFGDRTFAPDMLTGKEESLYLITRETVSEGASILRQIDPVGMLDIKDDDWDEYLLENLVEWRDFYLEADEKGEEILLGVL